MKKVSVRWILSFVCVIIIIISNKNVKAAEAEAESSRKLDQTPTWAVAAVCSIIIIISIGMESSLHKLGTWFSERQKKALFEALEKVKSELMILGFISLLLTFGQSYFAKICIPDSIADSMLPCTFHEANTTASHSEGHRRRLLSYHHRRFLASESSSSNCKDGCFFRQFFRSVRKADYVTLRNGFIAVHLAPGSKFNFQKYIKRSLEDDFKLVVGVSPVLWASFVLFMLLNVNGWHTMLWASLIPLILILAVGTNLQAILTKMAMEITDKHAVVQGIPLVQGSDRYFWFGRPQLLLHLIHFALFQNAFQITYLLWIWYSFNLKNCFHADLELAIIKVILGIAVLCLCSYITLPLYALVTQMGSRMKKSIFDEQTSKALKKWHMAVKKKQGKGGKSPTRTLGESVSPSISSTVHPTLQRFKTTGHSTRSYNIEASDLEAEGLSSMTNLIVRVDKDDDAIQINEESIMHQNDIQTSNELEKKPAT
ncbi:hypothetical protein ACFE04_026412 [Oxalis oulophora]